jgi:hypothetical protein
MLCQIKMPMVHMYVRRYNSVQAKELVSQVHVQCEPMHLHPKHILHIRAVMGLQLKPGVARVESVTPSPVVSSHKKVITLMLVILACVVCFRMGRDCRICI